MSTEYYNLQWQMPNEANKGKQANHSLNFDGTSLINTGTAIGDSLGVYNGSLSVSFWFKHNVASQWDMLFDMKPGTFNTAYGEFSVVTYYSSGTHRIFATVNSKGYYIDFAVPTAATQWNHLVFQLIYDSAAGNFDIKLYINGEDSGVTPTGTKPTTGQIDFSNGDTVIGGISTGQNYHGQIYGLSIFDYALSSSQVTTLYGTGSAIGNPMDLSPAPKAYYKLSDSIWNGSSYITPNSAVKDYVFDFSGALGESVITTSSYMPTSNYTVSLWFKHTMSTRDNYMFAVPKADNTTPSFWIYTLSGGVRATVSSSSGSGNADCNLPGTVNDGKWHQITVTWDSSGNLKGYLDGANETTSGQSPLSGTFVHGDNIGIGGYWKPAGSSSRAFDGEISNVLVLDTVLTATEAQTLYNYGSPIKTLANIPQNSNLKAWYKLDASEIYNSSTTEWGVENNANPSVYMHSTKLNGNSGSRIYLNPTTGNETVHGIILPNSFSFSFWINTVSTINGPHSGGSVIEGSGAVNSSGDAIWNMFRYSHFLNGKWTLQMTSSLGSTTGNQQVTTVINDGRWHHVLLTYDYSSTTLTVYTDNVQTYTLSTNNFGTGINVPRIGTSFDGNANSVFTGDLSNLSFWTSALTSSQRNEIYNNGTPKDLSTNSNYSNLLNWYKLNNDLQDSKGSNNGTGGSTTTKTLSFINALAGNSSGMSRSNLVQSDLSRVFNDNALSLSPGSVPTTASYSNSENGFYPSSGNFTFSVWLRNTSTSRGGIFSKGYSWGAEEFGLAIAGNGGNFTTAGSSDNGKLIFMFDTASHPSSTYLATSEVLESGKWYNFVATYTSGDLKLYLNGSLDNSTTSITKSSFADQRIKINNCLVNGWNWGGRTSNFAFFDTVLSATEVREIWNNGLPGDLKSHSKAANLKNWLKGARGAGNQVLLDYVGPFAITGMYTNGPSISSGFTDFQGTSSGFTAPSATVTNIVNDAPYSNKNAVSYNMQSTNRGNSSNTWTTPTSGRTTETPQAT